MILSAYFDESGTHAGSKTVCVAGYISTPDRWQEFEPEWTAILAQYGLASFHMTDFVNIAPPYRDLAPIDRRVLYGKLTDTISRHTLGSVGVAFSVADFEQAIPDKAAQQVAGGAYGVAVHSCFIDTARLVKANAPAGMVAYVFEQ